LIPKADQNLKVIQRSFEAGKSDFLSLIDAERVLLEFQLTYERAVADREQGLATVEKLVGGESPTLAPANER
jgi:outer membrane protein TolC